MPLDPRVRRFLDRLAASSPTSASSLTVEARRGALEQLLSFAGMRGGACEVEDRVFPGPDGPLRLRLYTPAVSADDRFSADHRFAERAGDAPPGLVYFHGGGLVAGSLDTHDGVCRQLARAAGCRLAAIDYRLAPEHPFPAAIEDGCAATAWTFEHTAELGMDPDRLVICGDSAGATLAAVVCQRLAGDDSRFRPALQFLLCPILDFRAETDSRHELAEGYFLDRATLEHDLRHYLGPGTDPSDPRVSPLRAADVSQVPPACIHTAEFDPLRDEGRAYAERLKQAGVATMYRCHPGMIHLFYGMGALIPYASGAFELMGGDIRAMLDRPSIEQRGDTP